MFRKYYKAANDKIDTNRELIDKIFEKSSVNKKSRKAIYSFGARYGTAFAVVLVFCAALVVFPKITRLNEESTQFEYSNNTVDEDSDVHITRMLPQNKEVNDMAKTVADYRLDISNLIPMTNDEVALAVNTLEEKLGKSDKDTGNMYIFEISGKLETPERFYYLGRWRWLVDDHTSLLCEFVLTDDLNELYECTIDGTSVVFNTNKNLF